MRKFTLFLFLTLTFSLCSCQQKKDYDIMILTGAEQLQEYLPLLRDKNIGLVINQSSMIGKTSLLDSLLSFGMDVKMIFSPEHGFAGVGDPGEYIYDKKEGKSGIKIISLYSNKRKPAKEDLLGLNILVFDIQDVGVRFYTYITTLHYVMEACAENNIPVLILDRPNPIGYYIDGPVLEQEYRSFLGMHPIPIVYGLTIGELALMINNEGWLKNHIKCKIDVIKCRNYTHDSHFHLPVNPSPNLRSMEAVYLYPTTGLFIGTEMSIGHGTEFPYLTIGHPGFIDHSFSFIPHPDLGAKNPKYNGQKCYGIDLRKLPVDSLRSMKRINIEIIQMVYNQMNRSDAFFNESFNYHAGNSTLKEQIIKGLSPDEIRKSWEPKLAKYRTIREKYLLYPDFGK
jgi:uncharacterized protein YbbC (DUF1343 family)